MAQAPQQLDQDRLRLETALRWITIAAGVLASVVIALSLAAHLLVDPEAVSARIRSGLAESAPGSVRVEMGSVTPTLLSRSLRAEEVTISWGDATSSPPDTTMAGSDTAAAEADSAAAPRVTMTIGTVELGGISLWRLVSGDGFAVEEARFIRPRVEVQRPHRGAAGAPDSSGRARSSDGQRGSAAPSFPYIAVGKLTIEDGSVEAISGSGEGRTRVRVDSMQAAFSGLVADTGRSDDWFELDDLSLVVGDYERLGSDSTAVTRINGLRIAGVASPLLVDSVTVRPTVDLAEFLRRGHKRKDRIDAALIGISVQDFDYRRFIERRDVIIRSVHADSLYLHVHSDKRLPAGRDEGQPRLPNRTMRGLEHLVRIDTIALRRGDILYTERPPQADSNAELWFREISGSARNVTNDTSLMSDETPAIIDARTRFLGEAPAHVTLRLPLLAENLKVRYLGNVGPFRATTLNEVTHPLMGMLLRGGAADSAWFDISIADGRAYGAVVVLYEGLELEIVGKGSSSQSLMESFKTMIAESKIESSNPRESGESPLAGSVLYAYEPDDPFFAILWGSLRSGLNDLLGL